MIRYLYVSDGVTKVYEKDFLDFLCMKCPLDLKKYAEEDNLIFERDDMDNCYLSLAGENAETFEKAGKLV